VPMRGAEWSGASLEVVTRALNAQTAGGGRRRRAPRVRNLSNDLFIQKRLDRFGTRIPMKSPKSDLLGLTTGTTARRADTEFGNQALVARAPNGSCCPVARPARGTSGGHGGSGRRWGRLQAAAGHDVDHAAPLRVHLPAAYEAVGCVGTPTVTSMLRSFPRRSPSSVSHAPRPTLTHHNPRI